MIKSIISLFLAVITLFSTISISDNKNDSNNKEIAETQYEVEGNNAIGDILSAQINNSKKDEEYTDATITDVSIKDESVVINYDSKVDGTVVIGIFDENTEKLLDTEESEIESDSTKTVVTIKKDLPENYIIKATVFDEEKKQVSDEYVSYDNTTSIEQLEASDILDYNEDLLINLDENTATNFAVLDESVILINPDECQSVVKAGDDTSEVLFEGADARISGLKPGDIFCYNKDDFDNMILNKVEKVSNNKEETVIRVSDVELGEAFEYVDIDYFNPLCYVDIGDNVENLSTSQEEIDDDVVFTTCSVSDADAGNSELTLSPSFTISSGAFSGTVSFTIGTKVKIKWVKSTHTFNCTFTIQESLSFTGKISGKIPLKTEKQIGKPVSIPLGVSGLSVKIIFRWKAEATGAVSFSFTISQTIGASITYKNKFSYNSLSTSPKISSDIKIEGKVMIQVIAYPALSFMNCCDVGIKGYAGVEVKGTMGHTFEKATEKHACKHCVDLSLSLIYGVELELGIDILFWSKYTSFTIVGEQKITFAKGYWSIDYGDFGFGSCPHKSYLTTIKVVDQDGKSISNAKVNGTATSNGTCKIWVNDGSLDLEVGASGYETLCICYGIDSVKTIAVKLKKGDPSKKSYLVDPSVSQVKKKKTNSGSTVVGTNSSTYVAPLTYTEPLTGVVLSTAVSGQRRSDTAWVQRELKKLGYYSSEPDGYYGYSTAEAVRKFQTDYNLPVTGQVNRNVVEVIKKPLKKVSAPNLKLTSSANITNGGIASVSWDAVPGASEYNVYVYNAKGEMVANAIGTKATNAAFVLFEKGTYTIKAESKNDRFTSDMATLGTKITVTDPLIITFENVDGTVLCKQYVAYGVAAAAPAAPEREGYTFSKWDTDFSKVTKDGLIVKPIFTKNQYTVKFFNTDGKEIVTDNNKYYYGDSAAAPSEDAVNVPSGYKFIGWDKDFSYVYEDIIVNPVIVWENDDIPIQIDNCTAEKDEGFGYNINVTLRNFEKQRTNGRVVVALKDANERFVTMTESSAFTLKKSDVKNNYISTETMEIFVPSNISVAYADVYVVDNYDDLIPISDTYRINLSSDSQDVEILSIKEYSGTVDPSMAGKRAILFIYKIGDAADFTNEFVGQTVIDENGNYTFKYNLREEPSVDTGDYYVVLGIEGAEKAIFLNKIEAPKPVYTVTFKNYDGSILKTEKVVQGDHAELPETNPERPGYIFAGWDYTNSSIYEDLTITAIYAHKIYTVVFIDWTNKRFDAQTYYYGEPIRTPDLSTLDDYNAIGWEGAVEGMPVTENMVITAKYEKKKFTVNFYDNEGNIIDTQLVEYGESATMPDMEEVNYNFFGWDNEAIDFVTSSMDIKPYFSYAEDTALPKANVASGIYSNQITVSLSCEEKADIYYSINGSDFILYKAPFVVDESATVEYYSSTFGKNASDAVSNYYVINKAGRENEWKIPVTVYKDGNIIGVYLVKYGSKISENDLYSEEYGYNFIGFCSDENLEDLLGTDYSFNAPANLYVKNETKEFTVTFKDNNDNVISVQKVSYMEAAEEPDVVIEQPDLIFIGWDSDDFLCVTEDVEVHVVTVNEKDYLAIKLNRDTYTMMEGYSYDLSVTINGQTDAELFWESSDESIATVDENGKVTALSDGVVAITVSLLGTDVSESCFITIVKNSDMSITLKDNSKYTEYEGYICGISPSANSVSTVRTQFETTENIKFFNGEYELKDSDSVTTGTTIKMYDENSNEIDSITLVVVGDVDGDGDANLPDASHISKYIIGKESLDEISLLAADVNGDGFVDNKDASMIMRYQVNKEKI